LLWALRLQGSSAPNARVLAGAGASCRGRCAPRGAGSRARRVATTGASGIASGTIGLRLLAGCSLRAAACWRCLLAAARALRCIIATRSRLSAGAGALPRGPDLQDLVWADCCRCRVAFWWHPFLARGGVRLLACAQCGHGAHACGVVHSPIALASDASTTWLKRLREVWGSETVNSRFTFLTEAGSLEYLPLSPN
jgi:hypothetical protein